MLLGFLRVQGGFGRGLHIESGIESGRGTFLGDGGGHDQGGER
jgi:hypothetical protein